MSIFSLNACRLEVPDSIFPLNYIKTVREQAEWKGPLTNMFPAISAPSQFQGAQPFAKWSDWDGEWDGEWDGTTAGLSGWTVNCFSGGSYEVKDHILSFSGTSDASFGYLSKNTIGAAGKGVIFEIEFRMKVISHCKGNMNINATNDIGGKNYTSANAIITNNRLRQQDNIDNSFDTSDWRRLRMVGSGEGTFSLYLDDNFIGTACFHHTSSSYERICDIQFNHLNQNDCFEIRNFRYATIDPIAGDFDEWTVAGAAFTNMGPERIDQIDAARNTTDGIFMDGEFKSIEIMATENTDTYGYVFEYNNKDNDTYMCFGVKDGIAYTLDWRNDTSTYTVLSSHTLRSMSIHFYVWKGKAYVFDENQPVIEENLLSSYGSLDSGVYLGAMDGTRASLEAVAIEGFAANVDVDPIVFNGLRVNANTQAYYTSSDIIELNAIKESIIKSYFGTDYNGDLLLIPDLLVIDDLLNPTGGSGTNAYLKTELKTDAHDWAELVQGVNTGKDYQLRLNVLTDIYDPAWILFWEWSIDMPDVITYNNVATITTGPVHIDFTFAYEDPPQVANGILDGTDNDIVIVENVTIDGCDVYVLNSGVNVIRTVNIVVAGY